MLGRGEISALDNATEAARAAPARGRAIPAQPDVNALRFLITEIRAGSPALTEHRRLLPFLEYLLSLLVSQIHATELESAAGVPSPPPANNLVSPPSAGTTTKEEAGEKTGSSKNQADQSDPCFDIHCGASQTKTESSITGEQLSRSHRPNYPEAERPSLKDKGNLPPLTDLAGDPAGYLFELFYPGSDHWSGQMFSDHDPVANLPADHVRNVRPLYEHPRQTNVTGTDIPSDVLAIAHRAAVDWYGDGWLGQGEPETDAFKVIRDRLAGVILADRRIRGGLRHAD